MSEVPDKRGRNVGTHGKQIEGDRLLNKVIHRREGESY